MVAEENLFGLYGNSISLKCGQKVHYIYNIATVIIDAENIPERKKMFFQENRKAVRKVSWKFLPKNEAEENTQKMWMDFHQPFFSIP